jgi:deoxyadenosine/deoxycytidine kinase
LFVFLHLETPKLQQNIKQRGRDYEQNIHSDYLDKIKDGYFDFMRQQMDMRILLLDTNNLDFVHNEDDYLKIIMILDKDYPKGVHRITF